MTEQLAEIVARETGLSLQSVASTIGLLEEGSTIPFISRYRKEVTGNLDEVEVDRIRESYYRLVDLQKRKETILHTIEEQGKLTDDLRHKIEECWVSAQLEDIYLPYRPKRRTKATIAKEKGLEPLAALLMRQDGSDPERLAGRFVKADVADEQEALRGAGDIIAEWVNESETARKAIRRLFERQGELTSRVVSGKELDGIKFADYYAFSGRLNRMPSHRVLALIRGEKEGILRLSVSVDEENARAELNRIFIKGASPARPLIEAAIKEGYKRLLKPSMETETMSAAKARADEEAIRVFAGNLRQLLLSSPLGQKRVLAIDPGFRTGCKVVCLDGQGNLLHNETIYPHPPRNDAEKSIDKLRALIEQYQIQAIAVGDGTAGRETEQLVRRVPMPAEVKVFMVSEDGASIYSASATGREEFPDYDVTVRGSVSIGRRLIDPLAELVKIDPKSIGVGQYQHDVDQARLKNALDTVVESCVNYVGVNLNTASKHLLAYVSGLGTALAGNIVEYRAANGDFHSRRQLMKVPRLGAKAFEQSAGFLRIPQADNPLDNSAVHPESYPVVEQMARDLGVTVSQLLADKLLQQKIEINRYVTDQIGLPTLQDILSELAKPGRDPRTEAQAFEFADIHSIDDLKEGMILPGIVTNITNFGAFVDVGIKQDGLVHVSQLADKYVSNPADVVKLHQHVTVRVVSIDHDRGRIGFSMKNLT
jgi:uncharacterized protein